MASDALPRLLQLQVALVGGSPPAKRGPPPTLQRERFYAWDEQAQFIAQLARAFPHLCTVFSLGHSRSGRDISAITLGAGVEKPAYLIYGCIHAGELSGVHACLYSALRLCEEYDAALEGGSTLHSVSVTIVPMLSPDGADWCARTGGRVRSVVHDPDTYEPNVLYPADVDGDGAILTLRQQHPSGEYVVDAEEPRLMRRREAKDSSGPYYRCWPEGRVHDWDGDIDHIAVPREYSEFASSEGGTGGVYTDLNRCWPTGWQPQPMQSGAGQYPGSEPELAGLMRWIHSTPCVRSLNLSLLSRICS
eukprot:SAG31_NODE_1430_length_8385_cov_3.096186_1_plen_305_part_00